MACPTREGWGCLFIKIVCPECRWCVPPPHRTRPSNLHLQPCHPLHSFTLIPATLGKTPEARVDNLVSILDGYAGKGERRAGRGCQPGRRASAGGG